MKPTSIIAATQQNGTDFFTADAPIASFASPTLVCHNLRNSIPGELQRAGKPALLGVAGGKPFIADRRPSGTYLLRQEDDGTIIIDGALDKNDSSKPYQKLEIELGTAAKPITQAQRVGAFIVLRYDDGSLGYIVHDPELDKYTFLGSLPDMPSAIVTMAGTRNFAAPTEAITFRKPIADLREGLNQEATSAIGKALATSWAEICSKAAKERYFLQPVTVRIALRLYDGQLLFLSDAIQADEPEFQNGGTVAFTPIYEDNATIGVAASQMTATGYRLDVSLPDFALGAWAAVVRHIEVWASSEPDPIDSSASTLTGISTSSHSSTTQIIARLPMHLPAEMELRLVNEPYSLACRVNTSDIPESMEAAPNHNATYISAESLAPQQQLPSSGICQILGHDGFLHIATSDGLMTSRRGNPFVIVATTPGDMRDVKAMAAQIWGGGAYTRQIIYVAREDAVEALAHDLNGKHTTYRTICSRAPQTPKHVCSGNDCVFMLLDGTQLVRFEGTRCHTLMRGIDGCNTLFFDSNRSELWLTPMPVPGGHAVVLGQRLTDDVTTRSSTLAEAIPGSDKLLAIAHNNGEYDILSLHRQDTTDDSDCRFLCRIEMPNTKGILKEMEIGIYGSEIDAEVSLGSSPDLATETCKPFSTTKFRIAGKPRGRLRLTSRPEPPTSGLFAAKGSWRLDIGGSFDTLNHISIH